MGEHKFNDEDFAEALRCLRSAWHENEELSAIPEPSEEARDVIVSAVLAGIFLRGLHFAKVQSE